MDDFTTRTEELNGMVAEDCRRFAEGNFYFQKFIIYDSGSSQYNNCGDLLLLRAYCTFGESAYCADIFLYLFRVTNIRFSKCSDVGFGNLTQPFEIRHPWLSSHSRQRPVAELLDCGQSIK